MKKFLVSLLFGVIGFMPSSTFGQANTSVAATLGVAWGTNGGQFTTATLPGVAAVGTNLFDGGANIASISIYNPTVAAIDFAIIDAPGTNNVNIRGATYYTNINNTITATNSYTNLVVSVTNFSGLVTNFTLSNRLVSGFVTNTITTNAYPRAYFVSVPPNTTVTPNLGTGLLIARGVTITNGFTASMASASSNLVVSITLDSSR
jgi:hypothetical protein